MQMHMMAVLRAPINTVVIVDNVHNYTDRESPTGTSADAAIIRLRKDALALHRRVLDARHIPRASCVWADYRNGASACGLCRPPLIDYHRRHD
jgi:hypothetical protein